MTKPKYPEITVKLVGSDGNAFALISKVAKALKRAGKEYREFQDEAMSGDYDYLLQTCLKYVNVE